MKEWEKKLSDQDLFIVKEKENNEKAKEEMNANLVAKDQRIVELDKCLANLEKYISRLNLELNEAKGIVEDAFPTSFGEARKQAKHFFVDKKLNFDLFDSSEFLDDIINQDGQMIKLDESQTTSKQLQVIVSKQLMPNPDPIVMTS